MERFESRLGGFGARSSVCRSGAHHQGLCGPHTAKPVPFVVDELYRNVRAFGEANWGHVKTLPWPHAILVDDCRTSALRAAAKIESELARPEISELVSTLVIGRDRSTG